MININNTYIAKAVGRYQLEIHLETWLVATENGIQHQILCIRNFPCQANEMSFACRKTRSDRTKEMGCNLGSQRYEELLLKSIKVSVTSVFKSKIFFFLILHFFPQ